jgi:hypothetical protein
MVLLTQGFGSGSALLSAASCLAPEEKVEGRARRIQRTIQVAPLALDPIRRRINPILQTIPFLTDRQDVASVA